MIAALCAIGNKVSAGSVRTRPAGEEKRAITLAGPRVATPRTVSATWLPSCWVIEKVRVRPSLVS